MGLGFGSKIVATEWLATIYFSEISFLFHLPLFISLSGNEDVYINTDKFDPNAGTKYLKRQFKHLKEWTIAQYKEIVARSKTPELKPHDFDGMVKYLKDYYTRQSEIHSNSVGDKEVDTALKKITLINDINNKIRLMTDSTADEYFQGNTPFFKWLYHKWVEFKRYSNVFLNTKERTRELWERKHPSLPLFQLVIFFIRCGLNLFALILIFYTTRENSGRASHEILHDITHGKRAKQGWTLFLISFIIYIVSYLHQRYHLIMFERHAQIQDQVLTLPSKLYWLSHLSVINFSLDLPGFVVPDVKLSHVLVCCINVVAAIILVFTFFAIEPFQKAWGCYPRYNNYRDYDYGMCPGFFSNDQARLQPVCDQPGVRCGKGLTMARDFFNREFVICQIMLSVSFAIYMLSITVKIDYFRTALDAATRKVHSLGTGAKIKTA